MSNLNELNFYKRLTYGALLTALVAVVLIIFQPRVQTPLGPLGAVMYNGIYCNSGETNCVESRSGMNIVVYSDDGATQKFKVTGATGAVSVTGGISLTGKLDLRGGAAPTAAAGSNAGTSPPAPVVTAGDNDTRGNITFGTGTVPAAGNMVVVTFNAAYAAAPSVFVVSKNTGTQALGLYVTSVGTTGFTLGATVAPAASQANTVYSFDYFIFQ